MVISRRPQFGLPKTSASLRDVPMPGFVAAAIDQHAKRFGLASDGVLCRTGRGTQLRRDYFDKRSWKPALAVAGLAGDVTFHDLRHTFASTALAESVPISEVSRWLGHKSITTTVDLCGHLIPEATGCARDALDKAFKSALNVPGKCLGGS
ncbi:tyrosine-type recombinase/integrase [Nonomuraea bangladeshensis]|uniref:tyrosine-type recombinase/integrase n=1 Tax=Nonomuraea bangladeshensis TaxID=404385 RepID=UPI0031DF7738